MRIKVRGSDQTIEYDSKQSDKNLWELLKEHDLTLGGDCNGKGRCGKCRVQLQSQDSYPISKAEQDILSKQTGQTNHRLACFIKPHGDIELSIVQEERNHRVLTQGFLPKFDDNPAIRKQIFQIQAPSLENPLSYAELFCHALKIESLKLDILEQIPLESNSLTEFTAIYSLDTLIGIEVGDTTQHLYGVSIDIGTTTVVATLVDLKTGRQIGTASEINSQTRYGSDVLTRISYVIEHGQRGLQQLQKAITHTISQLVKQLTEETKVMADNIYELVISANTIMTHILLGIHPGKMGRSPYVPITKEGYNIPAKSLGIKTCSAFARLVTLPAVSSFVGSDIVSGLAVTQLRQQAQRTLLIDIGTNGEIVLSDHGKMVSCSCAAGPALEGMNISSGMKAADGAIEEVNISPSGVDYAVIGQTKPIGICGSGILALIRELIKTGIITYRGRIIDPETLDEDDYRKQYIDTVQDKRVIRLPHNIVISQNDIRQVQLAKGAILAGIQALLNSHGIKDLDVDQVIVAGQFGKHVSESSLIGTGLLPSGFSGKITYIGNSSQSGAYLAQMSQAIRESMTPLSRKIDYIELSVLDGYDRLFAQSALFPRIEA